jgi:hypothetical protein
MNPFDADILKRLLRHKEGTPRIEDYQKIIHVCQERIRQLSEGEDPFEEGDLRSKLDEKINLILKDKVIKP